MICQVCGKEAPLTYRSAQLRLHSVCAPCIRIHFPYTLGSRDDLLRDAVIAVLEWQRKHPHRDYLDAAFAVVASPPGTRRSSLGRIPSTFSTGRWPELITAVREAQRFLTPATT